MRPQMVETHIQEGDPLDRARAFEKAGDARVYESGIEDAQVNYGWAIDAFLEARAFEEAIRICRKLIRLSPGVVRTRYTLLFLLVGLERYEEARVALEEYVRVVLVSGTRSFAIPRLQLLAHVTEDAATTDLIESILIDLGAKQLGYTVHLHRDDVAGVHSGSERAERWETLLPIALRDD
jgi:tetratricopeptide (TPR) repeat protein